MRRVRSSRYIGVAMCLAAAPLAAWPAAATVDPAAAQQSVTQPVSAAIDSQYPWQFSNAYVTANQRFTVSTSSSGPDGKAGTWTVDYRNWPAVGPDGYDRSTDRRIYVGCKLVTRLPYGRLLGRIGDDGPVFSVGAGGQFQVNVSGALNLRINDQDRCLVDNRGYIEVTVR